MLPEVDKLLEIWRRTLGPPRARLLGAVAVLSVLGAAHGARVGTAPWRAGAAAGLGAVVVGLGAGALWRRRRERDLRWALREVVGAADPDAGQRAERALGLVEQARRGGEVGSPALVELHLSRQLRRVRPEAVAEAAGQRGRRLSGAAAAVGAVAMVAVLVPSPPEGTFRVIEGLDVLGARRDRAPLSLTYLDGVRIEVQPPDYLRERPRSYLDETSIVAPYGSVVTFRGAVVHRGRVLVLTDGKQEVPFVDDGAGLVAARWPLKESAKLEVAARLGGVRVGQGDAVAVRSVPDKAPEVTVEGAPRTTKILEETEISVLYRATDDHGLREVDLVLRAGSREERRVLARLDGDTRRDEGGYQLRSTDAFLRQTYLPVEVTIEARDNDPLTGPKWGKSAAIVLLPPAIGEPEAMRYEGLLSLRGALVDLLASMIQAPASTKASELSAQHQRWREAAQAAARQVLDGNYGGLRAPRRMATFIDGQLRRLTDAMEAERKAPGPARRAELIKAAESVVLTVDRGVLALGGRDARSVSKRMARVALDAADQLGKARQGLSTPADGKQRAEAAMQVLDPSGRALSKLGALGADLGSIVANDLRRMRRALDADDLPHAELVAYDLGFRLQKANPSFAGGAGGTGEGGGHGKGSAADEAASGEGETPDDEESSFEAEQKAIADLLRDHAGNMEDTQQSMRRAAEGAQPEGFLDEARKHAEAVRDAMRGMSDDGAAAAEAREQAERMAQALERGDAREALEAARAAEKRLNDGTQAARRGADPGQAGRPDEMLGRLSAEEMESAARKLAPERRWVEDVYQKMQRAMRQGAELKETAERESRLADRAREIDQRGERNGLPESIQERLKQAEREMREAARAMARGDGEEALDHQRRAQHQLDAARPPEDDSQQPSQDDARPDPNDRNGRGPSTGPTAIPRADEHQGPDAFRRRVTEGLKQGQPPSLRDAIRRYAERLLK